MIVTNRIFGCLNDPIRLSIVRLLADSPLTAGEIAAGFEVSRPAVSRHLRVLREGGVVSESRSGRERIYRLRPEALERAAAWLSEVATTGSGRASVELERQPTAAEAAEAPKPAVGRRDWRQW